MQDWEDNALLREYAERGSEDAFAILVARHISKVHSVALRHTRNPHQAEEITQTVFVILARKAGRLGKKVILEGWLYQTSRLTALTAIRSEIRRNRREEAAQMQNMTSENESEVWKQIEPFLDTAMESLSEPDRHAVVLRYFYGKTMKEVGAVIGGSEGAATLRLRRALEKLRRFFSKRGISTTVTAIAAAITANSVQAAPTALTKSVTTTAVAKGVAAGGSVPVLVNAVMKALAWAKLQFAAGVTAVVILAAAGGTGIYALNKATEQKISQKHFTSSTWANEGFTTPESTLSTFFWASRSGDVDVFLDTQTKDLSQFMTNRMFRGRAEKERPAELVGRFKEINAARIERKILHPDGRVSLKLALDGFAPDFSQVTMTMTNIDGNWRICVLRMFSGSAYKEFPGPGPMTEAEFAPRADSDLQGYWAGAIRTPRGESKINIKIAEPTDGFFRAEFNNAEQSRTRPAWLIRDGSEVTFRLMWAVGRFEGKLSKDGKQLEGKWIQGSRELPATLTKTNWVKP